MANKVKYGLKNVHYALATEGASGVVFGTPKAIKGAVNLSLSAEGDQSTFYADDVPYYTFSANNGYSGDLEVALLTDVVEQDLLGVQRDTKGNIVEQTTDKPSAFALMFEFNGDEKATRHIMYYCKASRPNLEGETQGESIEPKTATLTITATPIPDTSFVKGHSTPESTNYDTWYSAAPTIPEIADVSE